MNLLDMRTLLIVFTVCNFLCMVVLINVYLHNRARYNGIGAWSVYSGFYFLTLLLTSLRNIAPEFVSITLANAFMIVGAYMLIIGLERYFGKTGPRMLNAAILIAFTTIHVYFTYIHPNLSIRDINQSWALAAFYFQGAALVFKRVELKMRRDSMLLGSVFITFCLVLIVRIIVEIFFPTGNDLINVGHTPAFIIMVLQMLVIMTAFAIVLTVNNRLVREMNEKLEKETRIKEALRASEEKFRSLFTEMLDGFALHEIICDDKDHPIDYRFLSVNPAFERITGLKAEQILGKTVLEVLPEIENIWIEKYGKVALSGEPLSFESATVALDKTFQVTAYCPVLNKFACIFTDITERKLSENIIQQTAERLCMAHQAAKSGTWDWDVTTGDIEWSNELFELFGLDPLRNTASFETWRKILHPEDLEIAENQIERALKQHVRLSSDYRILLPDGSVRWINSIGEGKYDELGNPVNMIGICMDITERKKMETILKESEEKYRDVLNNSPFPVAVVDSKDEIILFWSRSAIDLFGHNPSSVEEWYQLAYPDLDYRRDVINRWKPFIETAFQAQKPVNTGEYRIACSDGSIRICELYTTFVADNLIVTFNDITERKKAEMALLQREEILRLFTERSPVGIFVASSDGNVTYCNERYCKISGMMPEQGLGENWFKSVHKEDRARVYREWHESKDGKSGFNSEYRFVNKEGTVTNVIGQATSIKDAFGNITSYVGTVTDITNLKAAQIEKDSLQQQLLQAQKMEAIGTLAGGMAHDFNNMLAVIMGNAQMAAMELSPGEPLYEELSEITNASNRAKELTMQLLTFARKEKLDVKVVEISSLINDLLIILSRSINKKIAINIAVKQSFKLMIDSNQIFQGLLNICNNACHAMPDGGELTIESSKVYSDEVNCDTCNDLLTGDYCLIKVSDTGTGMSEEVKQHIFEPFFTTKEVGKGTGLGLSVTHGIIKSHNGHIEVDSVPGEGTTFKIYLPILRLKDAEEQQTDTDAVMRGNETILIIDDEEAVAKVGEKILKKCGYAIYKAASGKEALKIYQESKSEIALVILDMIMPEMDGQDVYYELRKINPDVKVIIASGYSSDGRIGALLDEGTDGFIQKPFKVAELSQLIRRVIDSK
jgi:two-component system, cell cycle sensor histidine kinase and response regulator CckA